MAKAKKVKERHRSGNGRKKVIVDTKLESPVDDRLAWQFGRLDHCGSFGCQRLVAANVAELEQELATFQDRSIDELKRLNWLKFVPSGDMTASAQ